MPVDGEIVLTRDLSSGQVHKRARIGDGLASLEGDNLDDAGEFDVLESLDGVDPADMGCRNCFPVHDAEKAG